MWPVKLQILSEIAELGELWRMHAPCLQLFSKSSESFLETAKVKSCEFEQTKSVETRSFPPTIMTGQIQLMKWAIETKSLLHANMVHSQDTTSREWNKAVLVAHILWTDGWDNLIPWTRVNKNGRCTHEQIQQQTKLHCWLPIQIQLHQYHDDAINSVTQKSFCLITHGERRYITLPIRQTDDSSNLSEVREQTADTTNLSQWAAIHRLIHLPSQIISVCCPYLLILVTKESIYSATWPITPTANQKTNEHLHRNGQRNQPHLLTCKNWI